MPFVKCIFNGDASKKAALVSALSKAASAALGKPEAYVCVSVDCDSGLSFGGNTEPCAMVQVQSIGGDLSACVEPITKAVSEIAGIPAGRIFVNFTSFERGAWGMGGSTLG